MREDTTPNVVYVSGVHDLPARAGKLKDLTKFDNTFFGVHMKQAQRLDPQLRMLLEVTYEAIVDAGTLPQSIYMYIIN